MSKKARDQAAVGEAMSLIPSSAPAPDGAPPVAATLPAALRLLKRAGSLCALLPDLMADARLQADKTLSAGCERVDAELPVHRVAVFGSKGAGKSTLVNCVAAYGLRLLPDQLGDTSRSMVLTVLGPHYQHDDFDVRLQLLSRAEWLQLKDQLVLAIADNQRPDEEEIRGDDDDDDAEDQQRQHITPTPTQCFERWLEYERTEHDKLKAVYVELNHVKEYGLRHLSVMTLQQKVALLNSWLDRAQHRQQLRDAIAATAQIAETHRKTKTVLQRLPCTWTTARTRAQTL